MSRTYTIPIQTQQLERRRALGISLGFVLGMSTVFGFIALYFRFDLSGLTGNDVVILSATLFLPCATLWLRAISLRSLCLELEDDRVSRTEILPLGRSQRRISFCREEIAHIREIPNQGLMIHGRNSNGRYIEMEIPRALENYDDLRSRLGAWQPIHESRF